MAELKVYLSESLNEKFRQSAMRVYGYGRGSLSKAAEEALAKWCSEHEPSAIAEKATGHSGTMEEQPPKKAESHINPDERPTVEQSANRIGGDDSSTSIGSSS